MPGPLVITPALIADLVAIRTAARHELYAREHPADWASSGGCWVVTENASERYGWAIAGGCYIEPDGSHQTHDWNRLPDGRILDATADQWGEPGAGVRITAGNDPRYDSRCPCSGMATDPDED